MTKASFGKRLIANIIDGIILFVINLLLGIVLVPLLGDTAGTSGLSSNLINAVVGFAYLIYFWTAWNGQTPGKRAMKIRIVPTDGSAMTASKAIVRYLGEIVSALPLLLGFVWILIDKDRQGWHDKIAKTYVVNVT